MNATCFQWLETVVMSWLIRIYSGGFSKIVSLSDQTRNAIDKFKQKLSQFLYETYTRFRIEQLFDIIIGIPLYVIYKINVSIVFIFLPIIHIFFSTFKNILILNPR